MNKQSHQNNGIGFKLAVCKGILNKWQVMH